MLRAADRSEGARVKAAKNKLFGELATLPKDQVNDGTVNLFATTVLNLFQFAPTQLEMTEVAGNANSPAAEKMTVALVALLGSALNAISGSALMKRSNEITLTVAKTYLTSIRLDTKVAIPIARDVLKRLRTRGFLD